MKTLAMIGLGLATFAATLTIELPEANAAVCARGYYRAGCVGRRGAVVTRRAPVCRVVCSRGICVRRCY